MELVGMVILFFVLLMREYVHRLEMREEVGQRSMLLQRIQAPREIAYKEFAETLPPGAPSEPIWSDEDAWKALGHLPAKAADDDMPELLAWRKSMGMAE